MGFVGHDVIVPSLTSWGWMVGIVKGLLLCLYLRVRGSKRWRQEPRRRPRHPRAQGRSRVSRFEASGGVTGAGHRCAIPRNSDTKFSPGRNRGRQGRACGKSRRIALERWKGSRALPKCRATFSRGFSGPRAVQRAAQNDPRGRCTLALSKIQSLGAAVRHALLSIASPPPQQASCLI
jgi:hypothetical protein